MAITFVKDTNGKVLVTDGTRKFSLDSSMNVLPHPSDTALIIISDSSAPLETREVFKFGWEQVTVPVITDRNDLIEKLGKFFFYNSFAATITFPTDLAKEAKQDSQIALATLLNTYVDGLEALLTTLNGKDFATQTTLALIAGYVDGIESILTTIGTNTTGINLETTQLLVKGVLDAIKLKTDNLDVALSTRATESTLIQVRDYLDTVETKLATLNLEATQLLIKAKTDNIDVALSTRLSKTDFEARINTLGQKTMANSTPVVLPSDQSISATVVQTCSTSTRTTTSVTTTATLILASNANRKKFKITNNSGSILYFGDNNTITTSVYSFRLSNNDYYEENVPVYTGNVYAIKGGGSGNVYVTEYT